MRILFAVHGYKPAYRIGGPIYSVSSLAEGLVKRGHKVVVFTTNSNQDQDLDVPVDRPVDVNGVEVWYFRRIAALKTALPFIDYFAKSLGFLYAPRMARELEVAVPRVDIVHTHMPFTYPSWASARAAFRHGKPLFYHQRGVLDPERLRFRSLKKKLYLELVEKPIMREATCLIALTDAEQENFKLLGIETPCEVIPNGIAIEPDVTDATADLSALGISRDAQTILFVGRIHPIKGADTLVQAFSIILEQVPQAMLVLAGPDEFGLQRHFRETARRRSISERVVFPGMVTGKLKKELFARARLFCLPSTAEGLSVAILEALAHGVPVLITPGCHFPEVEDANAGRVVKKDVAALAAAAIDLLKHPALLRVMGDNGRELVRSRYGWDGIVDRMIHSYEQGILRHGRSRT